MYASDWVEDDPQEPQRQPFQPSPPAPAAQPTLTEPTPALAPALGSDINSMQGASGSGLAGQQQPSAGASQYSNSPKWLDNFADAVTNGAKKAVSIPKKAVTGGNHLLHDPRFWTVTAGGAALGAAGVGTYFLLKNANKKNEPEYAYVPTPNGAAAAVPYIAPNGTVYNYGALPDGYPYGQGFASGMGYSSHPGIINPGYHIVRRRNGQTFWQTNPDGTMLNNFSTMGNINPFTNQQGWKIPNY